MSNTSVINHKVYSQDSVVNAYLQEEKLQAPEKTILDILKPRLGSMRMLDIGVGAGRTTLHCAPLVKMYVGVDQSFGMIEACRKRFANSAFRATFSVVDARSMVVFDEGSFDFVLFSFNGIDYMDHHDRMKTLKEIRRITTLGGVFCFSTHNFALLKKMQTFKFSINPMNSWRLWQRSRQVKAALVNPDATYAIIRDGGENFKTLTYYIQPTFQIDMLKQAGFSSIKIFDEEGIQHTISGQLNQLVNDRWLYFLCEG